MHNTSIKDHADHFHYFAASHIQIACRRSMLAFDENSVQDHSFVLVGFLVLFFFVLVSFLAKSVGFSAKKIKRYTVLFEVKRMNG